MGYSKKRRYRKKQRGGEPVFTYPEEDFRFAQIYALIKDPDLKKSVISEMNKDTVLLFSEQDLPEQRVDPGTLDLGLYKKVIEKANKELKKFIPDMFKVESAAASQPTSTTNVTAVVSTPAQQPASTSNVTAASAAAQQPASAANVTAPAQTPAPQQQTSTSNVTANVTAQTPPDPPGFTAFENQIKTVTEIDSKQAYDDINPFLKAFVKALYNAGITTLAPVFQEKAFLKELFPSSGSYIDSLYSAASTSSSSSAATDPKITVANLVSEITFPDKVDVHLPSLQNLFKLSRLNKIVIEDDIGNNKYSQIKSPSITELKIGTIKLTTIDQLVFLEACQKLKKITIVSSDLKVSITDVLEKLPSWEDKNVVLTDTGVKLEKTDFNKFIGLIKSKRVKEISLPNTITLETETQQADLEKALKNSIFGEDKTRAKDVEVKKIEKYEQLKNCFPKDKSGKDDFRIISKEEGTEYKYTVFENGMLSGLSSAGTCEFTTDNTPIRKLTSITFKKGTSEIMLDGFTSLTEIIIEKDATDLKKMNITGCTALTTLTIGATDFKNLETMNITGCTELLTDTLSFKSLDKLKTLNINNNGDKIKTVSLSGCKALKTITSLPASLTELKLTGCNALNSADKFKTLINLKTFVLTDAPITDTNFLKDLASLTTIDLTGCNNFEVLSLPAGLKTVLETLTLNQCTELKSIVLDSFVKLTYLKVEPNEFSKNFKPNLASPMSLTTVSLTNSKGLANLTLPPSVTSLTITEAKLLPNSNFLTGLDKLTSLTLEGFDIQTIDLTLCNRPVIDKYLVGKGCVGNLKTLSVSKCVNLTAINGLDSVSALQTLNITGVSAEFKSLVMTGCKALKTITSLTAPAASASAAVAAPAPLPTSLTDLNLTGCEALTTIGQLPTSLKTLYISWDGEIRRDNSFMPRSVETKVDNLDFLNNLKTNLTSLTLKGLNFEGPCELKDFTKLTDLIITEQDVTEFGRNNKKFIYKSHGLTSLTITGSNNLNKIGKLPSTLKTLIIDDSNIKENTAKEFLKKLTKLKNLTLKSSENYTIDSLPLTLETLVLKNSKITNGMKIFSGLKNLEIKDDSTISNIKLDMCRGSLETLTIENCISLASITDITGFQNIKTLYIDNCPVEKLVISDCTSLTTVSKLPTSLKELSITNSKITGADLMYLTGLETFVFTNNTVVSSLVVSAAAPAPASAAVAVPTVPAPAANTITIPTSVKQLAVVKISALTNITGLIKTAQLTFLHIEDCANLESQMKFDSFNILTKLIIRKCKKVRSFVINNCSNLTEIQGLIDMDALETLQITENGQDGSPVTMPDISSILIKSLKKIVLKGKSTNYLQTKCGTDYLPFKNLTSRLTRIELEKFKILKTGNSSPNLELKFTNEDTSPNNTLTTISFKNIEYFDTNSTQGTINLTVINCNTLTDLVFDNTTLFNQIIIRKCKSLELIPGIEGFILLELLSIEDLPITSLSVSKCPKLTKINRLTGLNALTTLNIKNNNSLTTIPEIKGLEALATVSVEECKILGSLTITSFTNSGVKTQNKALKNVNLTKLPALKTLRIEELPILTDFDLSKLPDASAALETLNVSKNPVLTAITGLSKLSALKTINVSENAITGTIEDFLGGLHDTATDKQIYLDKNADMTLGDENKVIEYIGTKKVTRLNRTGTKTENKNNSIKVLETSKPDFQTDFEGDGVVNGTYFNPKLNVDLGNMCNVLGKNKCDVAFYTTIDAALTAKTNATFDNATVSFGFVNGNLQITSLVLDGDQIDFTKLKDLDALKTLKIQNNKNIPNEFNNDKVLPHGLEELVITDCANFGTVNLDDQKDSLKTLKIFKDDHNVSGFKDFKNLENVELGKTNSVSVLFENCEKLANVTLHKSTNDVTVKNSPIFLITALDRLTAIDSLELENQPSLVLSEDLQKKIKKLVLKNVNIATLDVKDLAILEELEITGCNKLTSIEAVTPKIQNMVITGCNELTSIKAADKATADKATADKATADTDSTLSGLGELNHLDIKDGKITKLTINNCPLLGGATNDNSSASTNVVTQKTLTLPMSLTELVIEGDGVFEQTISTLLVLETLIIANNKNITNIILQSKVKTCKITNSIMLTTLNTESCKAELETLEIKNSQLFSNLNKQDPNRQDSKNCVNGHYKLQTLKIDKGIIEKISISGSQIIESLELPESVIDLIISGNNVLTELTIPKKVTSANIETFTVLTSISYEGTVMTDFNVENCRELAVIPDFKINTADFRLLQVSNCPKIDRDMVEYLSGVGVGKAIVPGGSTNKTRKVYGGMNNKTRRIYRGGNPKTIESVNFTGSGFMVDNIDNLVKIIGTKNIKKMFIPELVKTQIGVSKKANDFIREVKMNNDPNVNINEITNVEIQAEESYELKRNKIIDGLKRAFADATAAAATAAADEAEKKRLAVIEVEKRRQEEIEEEKRRLAVIEAEKKRLAQIEEEKRRQEEIEKEKRKLAVMEEEKRRQEEIEEEKSRLAVLEEEKRKLAVIEAENKRLAEIEEEKKAATEAEKKRLADIEAEMTRLETERQRLAAETEIQRVTAATEIYKATLYVCTAVRDIRKCETTKLTYSIGNLIKENNKYSLKIFVNSATEPSNTYTDIVYVEPDSNQTNPQLHLVIGYISEKGKLEKAYLKSAKDVEGINNQEWITKIRDAFPPIPLYTCRNEKDPVQKTCPNDTNGFITSVAIVVFKYDKKNKYKEEHRIKDIIYVSPSKIGGENQDKEFMVISVGTFNSQKESYFQTDNKENRDQWVKTIQRTFQLVPLKPKENVSKPGDFPVGKIDLKKLSFVEDGGKGNHISQYENITNVESSTSSDLELTITHPKSKTDAISEITTLVSDNEENRDWWVEQIQKMISTVKSGGKKNNNQKSNKNKQKGGFRATRKKLRKAKRP
jgi:hypothetical protein